MITLIENVGAINKSIRQTKIDDKFNQIIFDEFSDENWLINAVNKFKNVRENDIELDTKKSLRYWINYAKKAQNIAHYINDDYKNDVVNSYLKLYHELNASYDATNDVMTYDGYTEKVIIDELKKQGFNKEEICNTVKLLSPLQLENEDIDALYKLENMKIPFEVPKLNQLFKKNDNLSLEQKIENYMSEHNITYEDIDVEKFLDKDIYMTAKNISAAIKIQKLQNRRINKIRNHFICFGNIANLSNTIKSIYKNRKNIDSLNAAIQILKRNKNSVKYEYFKEATNLCHNKVVMSCDEEVRLFKENNADFKIAKHLLESGYNQNEIIKTLLNNSPVLPNNDDVKDIINKAMITIKQEQIQIMAQDIRNQKNILNTISEDFILEASKVLKKSPNTIWSEKENDMIKKILFQKGYSENQIHHILKEYSPIPIEAVEKEESMNLDKNNNLLSIFINKEMNKNLSNRAIMQHVMNKRDTFTELKDKPNSMQRQIILNTIKKVQKENYLLR